MSGLESSSSPPRLFVGVLGLDPSKKGKTAFFYVPRGRAFPISETDTISVQGDCCLVSFKKEAPRTIEEKALLKIKEIRRAADDLSRHVANPLHLFCRLKECGFENAKARTISSWYGKLFYGPVVESFLALVAGRKHVSEKPASAFRGMSVCPVPVPVGTGLTLTLE